KRAIRCVRYITDFCLMAQYRSHTPQTIGYMDLYRQKFHDNLHVIQDVLCKADFNFPKLHLVFHYTIQIKDFRSLPQYSTEVTEALHKPLKDAYRRSNCVNAAEQILDTITVEHALRM
ncbi:hypothetical protein BGX38DRAFT_1083833, partial [Terfezia claveryi]